jgi:ABC-type multidrug transport system fused ATPase/permease subunit
MRAAANRWALYFFILTLGTFAIMIFASYGLEYSGERIVSDYRRESVRALLKQEVAYFEDTRHTAGDDKAGGAKDEGGSAGGLTAAVAYHPSNVGSVIGLILGQVIVSAAAFIGTIILAFTLTWRLAVMVLPALALNTGAGYVNFVFQDKFDKQLNDDTEAQSSFVNESANSIQMLAALTREAETVRQFKRKFTDREMRTGWLVCSGVALGVSQGVLQLFGGLIFYWGAQQLARGLVSVANLFTIIEAVIVAVYICARIWTYTGDFARMNNSLRTIQVSLPLLLLFVVLRSTYMQKWLQRHSKLQKLPPTSSSTSLVEQATAGGKGDTSGITLYASHATVSPCHPHWVNGTDNKQQCYPAVSLSPRHRRSQFDIPAHGTGQGVRLLRHVRCRQEQHHGCSRALL